MRELLVIADKEGKKQSAFFHALELARNTGADIEFVGFTHAAGVDSSDILTHDQKREIHHKYIERKQAEMNEFLAGVDTGGVKIKTDVVWEKSIDRWVIARCDQKSFDMVFKSGNRTESFLYTPTDWQLMRYCPEPVMIVGDSPWKEGGKILAALDLGNDSQKVMQLNELVMRQSIKLSKASNSEVHVCYVMPIPKALRDLDLVDLNEYEQKLRARLDPVIARMFDDAGLPRERLHLVSGKPHKEICKLVDKLEADVVVIGNKTGTSLRGRLMGNTAENVLHEVKADVVVVK
ncbi:MAG: hypothetical protein CUN57_00240 [Phototrophicales bacterium]|nr:MAG: hypothetical protein CUN57_00240 [Phototrophicales bacterium]